VERVAAGRKRPYDQMEALAQGRVWMGAQAKQNGLVDELGGLDRALELVRERAKIPASEKVALVTYPPRRDGLGHPVKPVGRCGCGGDGRPPGEGAGRASCRCGPCFTEASWN